MNEKFVIRGGKPLRGSVSIGGGKNAAVAIIPAALLVDGDTGQVLLDQNSHKELYPASITKCMTTLLVLQAVDKGQLTLDQTITASQSAIDMLTADSSTAGIKVGEQLTVEQLLYCDLLPSANEACNILAEAVAGSTEAFVERMNRKAEELGMQETHFVNACGLDVDGHETSAYDIALMSRELMTKFPEVQKYTTTWQDTIIHKTRKGESEFGLTNTNKLIKWYEGATGLKTGSTGKALYCLSGTAERNGLHLIGVVMAAPDFKLRFQETMKLLDYGFANYSTEKGLPAGKEMGRIPVTKGMEDSVSAVVQEEISILLKKDIGGEWETKTELLPAMDAPVAAGEKVGELIYLLHGKEVGRTDLITAEAVEKANINTMLQRMLRQWF